MIIEPKATDAPIVSIREGLGRRVYPAGSIIFAEGEGGTIANILLRGDVTIFLRFGTDQQGPRRRSLARTAPDRLGRDHSL
jgi:hypothetical protein